MGIQTRIYVSTAFAFGKKAAVDNLLAANYSAVIIWAVHVDSDGTLILNNTQFVANGVYSEKDEMDIPGSVARLHKSGVQIIFSVGGYGTRDFTNIQALLKGGIPGPGNPLYDNFKALKDAMVKAGGNIDAIDYDNEDNMNTGTMVNFGCMLANIGYSSVTLCPFYLSPIWTATYHQLLAKKGKNFVSAIHLQCYAGGVNSNPDDWGQMIAKEQGNTLLIPGLATNQTNPGPWWDGTKPGGSVVQTKGVAMYKDADWSGFLWKGNFPTADEAMQNIKGAETFFFYCNGILVLGPDKIFNKGDAVFFGGSPVWGGAGQCDGYALSGGCSDIFNPPSMGGACPSNLQSQYQIFKKGKYPVNGGFIWTYDSIVDCVLSNCCGETGESAAAVAKDYQQAIVNGLS